MTNSEIMNLFSDKYPSMQMVDYRPLAPKMFTSDLVGITIWLDNGDVLQYYPKEAQKEV